MCSAAVENALDQLRKASLGPSTNLAPALSYVSTHTHTHTNTHTHTHTHTHNNHTTHDIVSCQ